MKWEFVPTCVRLVLTWQWRQVVFRTVICPPSSTRRSWSFLVMAYSRHPMSFSHGAARTTRFSAQNCKPYWFWSFCSVDGSRHGQMDGSVVWSTALLWTNLKPGCHWCISPHLPPSPLFKSRNSSSPRSIPCASGLPSHGKNTRATCSRGTLEATASKPRKNGCDYPHPPRTHKQQLQLNTFTLILSEPDSLAPVLRKWHIQLLKSMNTNPFRLYGIWHGLLLFCLIF